MGIFKRTINVLRGKTNKVLDKIEDPIEMLELAITDIDRNIKDVKVKSAMPLGRKDILSKEISNLEKTISLNKVSITNYMKTNEEEKALELLKETKKLEEKLDISKNDYTTLNEQCEIILDSIKKLEKKKEKMIMEKESYVSRMATVNAQKTLLELSTNTNIDLGINLKDIEQKIKNEETYVSGLKQLSTLNEIDGEKSTFSEELENDRLKQELKDLYSK